MRCDAPAPLCSLVNVRLHLETASACASLAAFQSLTASCDLHYQCFQLTMDGPRLVVYGTGCCIAGLWSYFLPAPAKQVALLKLPTSVYSSLPGCRRVRVRSGVLALGRQGPTPGLSVFQQRLPVTSQETGTRTCPTGGASATGTISRTCRLARGHTTMTGPFDTVCLYCAAQNPIESGSGDAMQLIQLVCAEALTTGYHHLWCGKETRG